MTAAAQPAPVRERRHLPCAFSDALVPRVLDGSKTQTRRIAKFLAIDGANLAFSGMSAGHFSTGVPSSGHVLYSRRGDGVWEQRTEPLHCPYGAPGDRLWVREGLVRSVGGKVMWSAGQAYVLDGSGLPMDWRWKPRALSSRYCPRWASRIDLQVAEIRVQRLKEISEEDAVAEGAFFTDYGRHCHHAWSGPGLCPAPDEHHPVKPGWSMVPTTSSDECLGSARMAFGNLWEVIHGFGSWDANPWVWAITFRRTRP